MSDLACECAAIMSSEPDKVAAARKGRLRQRYDNEYRLVAGCVPYRVKKDDEGNPCSSLGDDPAEVEVLMISTPNRTDMVFPKGGWEDDEDVYHAAGREAMEEAGVKGIISRAALGHWVFKSKSSQKCSNPRGACKGYIFAMEVTEELESWPEQDTHSRRWLITGTGLPCRSLPPLPVRLDARGAHGAAGAAIGDRAGGGGGGGGAGADRPGRHVHDAAGDLGRRCCAVLISCCG